MPKGRSGNPAGRPKGCKNKRTVLKEELLAKAVAKYKTPLDFLLGTMVSDKAPMATRIECAKAAAPYVHKRQPTQIENGPSGAFRILDIAKLKGMSTKELTSLRNLLAKAQPEDDE